MRKTTLALSAAIALLFAPAAIAGNTIFETSKGEQTFPFAQPTTAPGHVAPGTIDNMTIGSTTPGPGYFTAITGPSAPTANSLIVLGGNSTTSASQGGAARLHGGTGGATGVGGDATVRGGVGGTTSGAGGLASLTGGAATAGNSAGGLSRAVGGAGQGTGAGGAAQVTGGASGAGATGTGGAAIVTGGASLATNGAGGTANSVGGAGAGTGAGGTALNTGGVGGATGAGGAAGVAGGAGGATSGAGGVATVTGGAGSAGNANGGDVTLAGGAANGSGVAGVVRQNGVRLQSQAAQATQDTAATLTAVQVLNGILTSNPAGAINLQLPLATAMDTALPTSVAGDSFDFTIDSLAGSTNLPTVTTNTGWTLVGNMTFTAVAGNAGRFRIRKTGTGAWTIYRLA